jgi:hypothetical protein
VAIAVAYVVAWQMARVQVHSHGASCRVATTVISFMSTIIFVGFWYGLYLSAAIAVFFPSSWLWWPPLRVLAFGTIMTDLRKYIAEHDGDLPKRTLGHPGFQLAVQIENFSRHGDTTRKQVAELNALKKNTCKPLTDSRVKQLALLTDVRKFIADHGGEFPLESRGHPGRQLAEKIRRFSQQSDTTIEQLAEIQALRHNALQVVVASTACLSTEPIQASKRQRVDFHSHSSAKEIKAKTVAFAKPSAAGSDGVSSKATGSSQVPVAAGGLEHGSVLLASCSMMADTSAQAYDTDVRMSEIHNKAVRIPASTSMDEQRVGLLIRGKFIVRFHQGKIWEVRKTPPDSKVVPGTTVYLIESGTSLFKSGTCTSKLWRICFTATFEGFTKFERKDFSSFVDKHRVTLEEFDDYLRESAQSTRGTRTKDSGTTTQVPVLQMEKKTGSKPLALYFWKFRDILPVKIDSYLPSDSRVIWIRFAANNVLTTHPEGTSIFTSFLAERARSEFLSSTKSSQDRHRQSSRITSDNRRRGVVCMLLIITCRDLTLPKILAELP